MCIVACLIWANDVLAQAGLLDQSFAAMLEPKGRVMALLDRGDGKVLAGLTYSFDRERPAAQFLLAFEPDGTPDSSFVPFAGFSTNPPPGAVTVLGQTSAGKFLVGGLFRGVGFSTRAALVRLNADGSPDGTFATVQVTGSLRALLVGNDQSVLVGGDFSSINGIARTNLARLHPDGAVDLSFNPAALTPEFSLTCQVNAIAEASEGKILIAGTFARVDGLLQRGITRFNADGSHDAAWTSAGVTHSGVYTPHGDGLALDADDKILLAGAFTHFNGTPRQHLVRLHGDGSVDMSFTPNVGDLNVNNIVIQNDRRLVIGGSFAQIDGQERHMVARLNSDGTLDPSFDAGFVGIETPFGVSGAVVPIIHLPSDKWLIGGQFDVVTSVPRTNIARLHGDLPAGPGRIQFVTATTEVAEDRASEVALSVARTDGIDGVVAVRLATSNLTAVAGRDYVPTNVVIQFNAREFQPKTIRLQVIDDPYLEMAESFAVTLTEPTGGVSIGQPSMTVVTILPNDCVGCVDTTHHPGSAVRSLSACATCGEYSLVNALLAEPDGSVLVGGDFRPRSDGAYRYLARLLSDGSLDPVFNREPLVNGPVHALARQADGKLLVGGDFFGGGAYRLVRLEQESAIDFTFNIGTGPDAVVRAVRVQPDGKILAGGEFRSWNDRLSAPMVRLQTNGAIDTTFNALVGATAESARLEAMELQTNGEIYIGGFFQSVGGKLRNGIARLNPNGSVNTNFVPPIDPRPYDSNGDYTFLTHCLRPLRNGQVLVGGEFNQVGGFSRHGLVRFNADGSVDPIFNAPFDPESYALGILEQPDGKLLVTGSFITDRYYFGGVIRLYPNGSVDESFRPAESQGLTESMVFDNTGGIVVGGNFDGIDGTQRFNVARLLTSVTAILQIERVAADAVRISWPVEFADLIVEQSGNLNAGGWSALVPSGLNGNRYAVTNGVSQAPRYYRAEFR